MSFAPQTYVNLFPNPPTARSGCFSPEGNPSTESFTEPTGVFNTAELLINQIRFPLNVEMNINHEYWHLRDNDPNDPNCSAKGATASVGHGAPRRRQPAHPLPRFAQRFVPAPLGRGRRPRVVGTQHLYVCDMSVMPFSSAANPVRTLAALALRFSRHFG